MANFSVLIITHGREDLLWKCLDSLRPPLKEWQLVLMMNGKELSENILEKVRSLSEDISLVHSIEKLTPGAARNKALQAVKNEWVYFLDDDAYLLPGYWDHVLEFLSDPKIDVIGGPDSAASAMTPFSEAISLALSSPFCTGMTFSRHRPLGSHLIMADEEKLTSCNLWVRKSLMGDAPFPVDFKRAEETVMLHNLGKNGARMYYHPKMMVAHYRRKNIVELVPPTFLAGFYRSRSMTMVKTVATEVFWLPSVFVLIHLVFFLSPVLFWQLAKLYVGVVGTVSLGLAVKNKQLKLAPVVFLLHYGIVFLYGLGFLYERAKRIKKIR